ncbi:MAG: DoxX family protein [Nannocystaceae bacterium]|nr:DoxX family protein [Nannocystaceae bacterium]
MTMLGVILRWVLAVFALGSGVVKVYGIEVERAGAEALGVPYLVLQGIGGVQLAAAVCLASGRTLPGTMLLGASYVPVIYLGVARGQPALVWASVALIVLTLALTRLSATG